MRRETFISYNERLCVGRRSTLFQLKWQKKKECHWESLLWNPFFISVEKIYLIC